MMKPRFNLVFLFLFYGLPIQAQQLFSLDASIDSALFNNLGLMISRNEATISSNNFTTANAGMLPTVDLNSGMNFANNNLDQKFNTGGEIKKNGVISKSYNGQIAVNWTLFDGTRMFAVYNKLSVLDAMGKMNVQLRTEEIVSDVIKAYAEIVKQKILLKGTLSYISLYEERVNLANAKVKVGKSAISELLQASIDLNVQKSNLIKQTSTLKTAKINLSKLMMRPLNDNFEIADSLDMNKTIKIDEVLDKLESGNRQLQFLRLAENQKLYEIKEQQSFSYPRVNLNAGYNFTTNSSTQGLFLKNQSHGPVVGLSLNWNLYNGVQRNLVKNSKLQYQNTKLMYEDTKLELQTMATNRWQQYNDAILLANAEQESYNMTVENLKIIMERFKLGEATILELKDAQQSSENSLTRLANTMYDAKTAETDLLFIVGGLIK